MKISLKVDKIHIILTLLIAIIIIQTIFMYILWRKQKQVVLTPEIDIIDIIHYNDINMTDLESAVDNGKNILEKLK